MDSSGFSMGTLGIDIGSIGVATLGMEFGALHIKRRKSHFVVEFRFYTIVAEIVFTVLQIVLQSTLSSATQAAVPHHLEREPP
jgi:hypothetical protein